MCCPWNQTQHCKVLWNGFGSHSGVELSGMELSGVLSLGSNPAPQGALEWIWEVLQMLVTPHPNLAVGMTSAELTTELLLINKPTNYSQQLNSKRKNNPKGQQRSAVPAPHDVPEVSPLPAPAQG